MKIVVTGANGFLGSSWLARFGAEHEVVAVGRSLPEGAPSGVKLAACDLSRPGALAQAIAAGELPDQVDAVVHLAVSRLHRGFPATALDLFEVNVAATAHLLDYARRAGAGRFLLGSTGSVYDGLFGGDLVEGAPLAPQRYFPASKHAAELLAGAYRALFPVATLRFFAPYGPGQTERLIPDLIARVREGRAVDLPEDGDGLVLATIFLSDAVEIIDQALRESWDEEVNVAAPEFLSLTEMVNVIAEQAGRAPIVQRRSGVPSYRFTPDLSRLGSRRDLGSLVRPAEGVARILAGS